MDEKNLSEIVAVISNDIKYIKDEIKDLKNSLEHRYVTKEEFKPIQKLVYGFTGIILFSVVGAILALVIRSHYG